MSCSSIKSLVNSCPKEIVCFSTCVFFGPRKLENPKRKSYLVTSSPKSPNQSRTTPNEVLESTIAGQVRRRFQSISRKRSRRFLSSDARRRVELRQQSVGNSFDSVLTSFVQVRRYQSVVNLSSLRLRVASGRQIKFQQWRSSACTPIDPKSKLNSKIALATVSERPCDC